MTSRRVPNSAREQQVAAISPRPIFSRYATTTCFLPCVNVEFIYFLPATHCGWWGRGGAEISVLLSPGATLSGVLFRPRVSSPPLSRHADIVSHGSLDAVAVPDPPAEIVTRFWAVTSRQSRVVVVVASSTVH